MNQSPCPLCQSETAAFWQDKFREYRRCGNCDLISVPSRDWLSEKDEKAVYDLHENDVDDAGYQRFLSRLADPLLERLPSGSRGLDFGCGPGPALAQMLERRGHNVDLYDLYYYPRHSVWQTRYQFITATEVVEHLKQPGQELLRLWELLESGGLLGIMTKKARDLEAFRRWHYKNDQTHIVFFSEVTFDYVCRWLKAELVYSSADVAILKKL